MKQASLFGTVKAPFRRRVVKAEKTIPQQKKIAEDANVVCARIVLESAESIAKYGGEQGLMVRCSRMCLERLGENNA